MECFWKTWRYHEHQPTNLFEGKGVQVCSSSINLQFENLASLKRRGNKNKKCTKIIGKENAGHYVVR